MFLCETRRAHPHSQTPTNFQICVGMITQIIHAHCWVVGVSVRVRLFISCQFSLYVCLPACLFNHLPVCRSMLQRLTHPSNYESFFLIFCQSI